MIKLLTRPQVVSEVPGDYPNLENKYLKSRPLITIRVLEGASHSPWAWMNVGYEKEISLASAIQMGLRVVAVMFRTSDQIAIHHGEHSIGMDI